MKNSDGHNTDKDRKAEDRNLGLTFNPDAVESASEETIFTDDAQEDPAVSETASEAQEAEAAHSIHETKDAEVVGVPGEEVVREEIFDEPEKPSKKEKKRISPFLVFLICWLVVLTGFLAWFLIRFNDFAGKYESQYQDALPFHTAELVAERFNEHDVDYIIGQMTSCPAVTVFEDDTVIRDYVTELLDGRTFVYSETENSRTDFPEYYIKTTDGLLVAKVNLAEDTSRKLPYGNKAWVMSSLEFYTAASYSFNISAPETYKVYVNGVELSEINCEATLTESELTQYVEPYATIPGTMTYTCEGLYMEPTVTAVDYRGNECECVYDESTDKYVVDFIKDFDEYDELSDYGISFASTFANYISQDAGPNALDKYFPSGSQALSYIKRNSSRDLYTTHGRVEIANEEIRDVKVFSDDVIYMEVYVEQLMEMYWGSDEPEVVPTDAHVYFVKIDGKWYVGGIQY